MTALMVTLAALQAACWYGMLGVVGSMPGAARALDD